MKKILFSTFLLITLILAACNSDDSTTLKIAASPSPHTEILEEAKPLLKEKGIDLDIVTVNDYTTPHVMTDSGDVDANYFQHIPHLEETNKNDDYDFVNMGAIHLEPIAAYTQRDYDSLSDLPNGAKIMMSTNVADEGRILKFFSDEGLITLKDGVDEADARLEDIEDNPHDFKFDNQTAPEMLLNVYNNDEGDVVFINSNYALDGGLVPSEDSIAIEDADSKYVNIIAANKDNEDNEAIKTLVEVLQSDDIKQFIKDKYDGAVIPSE